MQSLRSLPVSIYTYPSQHKDASGAKQIKIWDSTKHRQARQTFRLALGTRMLLVCQP